MPTCKLDPLWCTGTILIIMPFLKPSMSQKFPVVIQVQEITKLFYCTECHSRISNVLVVYHLPDRLVPSCWPRVYWQDETNAPGTNVSPSCTRTLNLSGRIRTLKSTIHCTASAMLIECSTYQYAFCDSLSWMQVFPHSPLHVLWPLTGI